MQYQLAIQNLDICTDMSVRNLELSNFRIFRVIRYVIITLTPWIVCLVIYHSQELWELHIQILMVGIC